MLRLAMMLALTMEPDGLEDRLRQVENASADFAVAGNSQAKKLAWDRLQVARKRYLAACIQLQNLGTCMHEMDWAEEKGRRVWDDVPAKGKK